MTTLILVCTSYKEQSVNIHCIWLDQALRYCLIWLHRAASRIAIFPFPLAPTPLILDRMIVHFRVISHYFDLTTQTREIWRLVGGTVRVKDRLAQELKSSGILTLKMSVFELSADLFPTPTRLFPPAYLISNWRKTQTIICGGKFFTRIL